MLIQQLTVFTLGQASKWLSEVLGTSYEVDVVESLLREGRIAATVRRSGAAQPEPGYIPSMEVGELFDCPTTICWVELFSSREIATSTHKLYWNWEPGELPVICSDGSISDNFLEGFAEELVHPLAVHKVTANDVVITRDELERVADEVMRDSQPGSSASIGHAVDALQYSWRITETVCEVIYAGKSLHLKPQLGFRYIARLLLRPYIKIDCVELHAAERPRLKQDISEGHDGELMSEALSQQGITVRQEYYGDDAVDRKTMQAVNSRINELTEEIAVAEERGDIDELERLEDQLDKLTRYRAASTSVRGRSRKLGDPRDKVRSSVTMAIRSALTTLAHDANDLAAHLREAIKTGGQCCYSPRTVNKWEVSIQPRRSARTA